MHHFELLNSLFYPSSVFPQGKIGLDDAKENTVFQASMVFMMLLVQEVHRSRELPPALGPVLPEHGVLLRRAVLGSTSHPPVAMEEMVLLKSCLIS